jgi:multidrug efflux system outer membrane protein
MTRRGTHGARGLLLCAAASLMASGCAVGPNYRRPEATTVPAAYQGPPGEWKVATPSADVPKGRWWELFGDKELDRLEDEAAAANQELKAAAARFAQARALAGVAEAGLFPRVSTTPSAVRQHDSQHRPVGGKPGKTYDTLTIPFDASWELDLWGGVRRRIEAATAQGQASAADLQSAALAVQAEVAADYLAVRALDAELALLRSTVEVYRRSLDLMRNRRAGGVATDLDVAQAETALAAAETQIPALALQRIRFQNALAVLTGKNPSLFQLPERPLDIDPPVVPTGIPSELLERRPDVAAAERRMAAANASIGVATAAFYPTLRLSGSAGLQSGTTNNLLELPSRFWAVGPSLSLPIFDGGQLSANLRAVKASYEEAVARYRQTVLAAFGDVETNLAAELLLAEQDEQERVAVQAARKQLEISENRYRAGLVTYLQVAVSQNLALEHERASARLRGQRCAAAVAMVKSLGGTWKPE